MLLGEAETVGLLVIGNRHGTASAALGLSVNDRLAAHHEEVIMVVQVQANRPGRASANGRSSSVSSSRT